MFTRSELEKVIPLVRASVSPTPQYAWPLLEAQTGVQVVVKHENHTPIGAFKVRGGLVYFERLKRERPQVQGIITATRGNHGQSLAYAGARAGVAVTIVVPHATSTRPRRQRYGSHRSAALNTHLRFTVTSSSAWQVTLTSYLVRSMISTR